MSTVKLAGREPETEAIRLALDVAATGVLTPLWVDGRRGVGRSALLSYAAAEARARGFRVLVATGHELERWPFAVVAELLDLAAEPADPAGAADALLRACRRPTLIAVDDVHLADEESVAVLNHTVRRARVRPLAVVCVSAEGCLRSNVNALGAALQSLGARVLHLDPLDPSAVAELVRSAAGLPPGPALSEWMDGAAGYPLWAIEMIEALVRVGALEEVAGRTELVAARLPGHFVRAVVTRVRSSSEDAAAVVEHLAFLGSAATPVVHAAAGKPPPATTAALHQAALAGLVHERDGCWEIAQPFVRAAVYESVPVSARSGKHRALAARLRRSGVDASVVADQLLASARDAGFGIVGELVDAAKSFRSSEPLVASSLLERALELTEDDPEGRALVLDERCETALSGGFAEDAEEAARALLDMPQDALTRARASVLLGRSLILQRRWADAVETLAGARAAVGDPRALSEALAHEALARAWGLDLEGAEACLRDAGVHEAATAARASLAFLSGNLAGAADIAAGAFPTVDRAGAEAARIRWMYGGMLAFADRHDEAERLLSAGLAAARAQSPGSVPALSYFYAVNAYFRGDWAAVESRLETDPSGWIAPHVRALEAWIALRRDEVDLAGGLCATYGPGVRSDPRLSMWFLTVQLQLPGVDEEETLVEVERTLRAAKDRGVHHVHWHFALLVAQRALQAGRRELAEEMRLLSGTVADRNALASPRATAEIVAAVLDADPLRARRAQQEAARSPRPLLRADVAEAAGRILLEAAEKREGIASLTEALRIFDLVGAHRDSARVGAALRRLGVTRRTLSKGEAPASGLEGLTPAEWRVAELAAQGETTRAIARRLFVSPRTVQSHLGAVFAKLGVSTRAELAALVSRRLAAADRT